jgi:5'-AMP-activated protein kinase regulatory gamma subunit
MVLKLVPLWYLTICFRNPKLPFFCEKEEVEGLLTKRKNKQTNKKSINEKVKIKMAEHRPDQRESQNSVVVGDTSFFFIQDSATTKDIPFHSSSILEFTKDVTLGKALHSLADHGVLSAPVWDQDAKKYLGFVDVFDLMTLAVGVDVLMHILPDSMLQKKPKSEEDLRFQKEMTLGEMMGDSAGGGGFNPWCPVEEGAKFRDVVRLLATKARRVPVLSKTTGKVIQIISQSQVCALLYERVKAGGVLNDTTPGTTGLGLKPVFSIKDTDQARDAFQLMVDKQVSSVCVVDENGEILTAVSTKDIRLLPRLEAAGLDRNNLLDMNVREFVGLVRRATEIDGKSHAACVTVELNTPLATVLGKLAATKMHRVYVIDPQRRPVGVISVSDVVVALAQIQPPQ